LLSVRYTRKRGIEPSVLNRLKFGDSVTTYQLHELGMVDWLCKSPVEPGAAVKEIAASFDGVSVSDFSGLKARVRKIVG